jgi:hypothetical protein
MHRLLLLSSILFLSLLAGAQEQFQYDVALQPVAVPGLPGLHSYSVGQHDGKWLIIGGRRDGLHARQPFNAFPAAQNNTDIFVIDQAEGKFYSRSIASLPTSIAEQLQSTNMVFYQDADTLYLIGGYAFSATEADHITFPNLSAVHVSGLIDAVISGQAMDPFIKQIRHDNFAVTGGQMGKIGDYFYLIGGHRFDGRYNPMGNPTFTQTYTNQVRKFRINNSGESPAFFDYSATTDPIHLRRRDYNLVPQVFPDGSEGYTISSGVFQLNADLPFLYPVDITADQYIPRTAFNQYLSNYHSPKVGLYSAGTNDMFSIFFGGISQYYFEGGQLIQDNEVPFVKTISMVSRSSDGNLQEYQLPTEMPGLKGASAEFIHNTLLPRYSNGVIKLDELQGDTVLIGHILGGIQTNLQNPFSNNQTSQTAADNVIYSVSLIKNIQTGMQALKARNPFEIKVFPNPNSGSFSVSYLLWKPGSIEYFISDAKGQIIKQGSIDNQSIGAYEMTIETGPDVPSQMLTITLVFENRYFATEKIFKQ